jgi:hypothetical protein
MMERLAHAEGFTSDSDTFLPSSSVRPPPRAPSSIGGSSVESDVSETTKAIASSSALVGECIIESGFSSNHAKRHVKKLDPNNNEPPSVPPKAQTEWGGGMTGKVSAGLGWIQQQRERRKREALERQVEEQRLRLYYEAQQGTSSLAENSTFQQLLVHPHDIAKTSAIQPSRSGSGIQVDVPLLGDNNAHHQDDDDEKPYYVPQVRLEEEDSTAAPPFILSLEQMNNLSELALPASIAYSRWKRIYCLARDGDSFDQFLRKVEKQSHTLLVIRTTKGAIFGAYAESPWEPHGPAFYGSAQACLYSFTSSSNTHDHDDQQSSSSLLLRVFKWTGENRYIQVCDSTTSKIAFGGGGEEGAFGLCLEHDFRIGSTGPCDTFYNEPLCMQENFQVVDVEVYGFLLGQF